MKLIKVFATWCGPCKALDKLLRENNIKYESIDIDSLDGEGISMKYNVSELPTLLLLDDNENLIRKNIGVPTQQELMKFIYETS